MAALEQHLADADALVGRPVRRLGHEQDRERTVGHRDLRGQRVAGGEAGVAEDQFGSRIMVEGRVTGHDAVPVGVLQRDQVAGDGEGVGGERELALRRTGLEDGLVHRDLAVEERREQHGVHGVARCLAAESAEQPHLLVVPVDRAVPRRW